MKNSKVFLLFLTLLTIRPSALGENFTALGLLFLGCCIFVFFIENYRIKRIDLRSDVLPTVILVSVYGVYVIVQSTITNSPILDFTIKGFITNIFVTFSFALLLSDNKVHFRLFRLCIQFMILLIISYYITIILSLVIPLDSLILFQIDVYGSPRNIYFPLTPIYGVMTVENHVFQRFLGFFREAGITQAFIIWAYVSLKHYGLENWKNKIVLITGIIATFSTAGIAVFVATICFKMLLNGKKIISLFVIPMIYVIIMYAPYVGLADKLVTHGTSVTDRTGVMLQSLKMLFENPFGIGVGNSPILENSGINFVAYSHMIGIIGVFLLLAIYFAPNLIVKNKKGYMLSVFPIFTTSLFSQPIIDAPFMFVMILASVIANNNSDIKKDNINLK